MAVTKGEVEWVARLARLELSPKEVEKFTHQLGEILDYFQTLREVPLEGVEPTSHPLGVLLPLRTDRAGKSLPTSQALSNAPKEKGGHFKVPPVLSSQEKK